jgi:hypothetical protein
MSEATHDCPWMVVYPAGDRARLDVAMVGSWERSDYDLASRETFLIQAEAIAYARSLAAGHGKRFDAPTAILDEA